MPPTPREQPDTNVSMVTGTIRTGRSVEVKQRLIKSIAEAWTQITGQPLAHLVAAIAEIPPEVVMEYGLFLPAPGERGRVVLRQQRCAPGD